GILYSPSTSRRRRRLRPPFTRRCRWLSPCLDPLDRTGPDPELCSNLQDALVSLRQGLPDSCLGAGRDPGATKDLAIGPRPLEASIDPADDHGPFELSEDAQHLEHGLARWRRGVDALLVQVEIDTCSVYLTQERHEVLERAAKTIHAPGRDHVGLAPCCSLE